MIASTAHAARTAAVLGLLAIGGVMGLTAAPALAEDCPNAQLRAENNSAQLPECRAYELVTNPFKEGFAPVGANLLGIQGIDGALAYESAGNFAGDGLGSIYNSYVATRSATGWLTASSNPSGPAYSESNGSAAQALSADLRSSLWLMRPAGDSTELEDYYVRGADGTFTRIGPALNPATAEPETPGTRNTETFGPFVGSVSADLSHMTFDTTGRRAFPGAPASGSNNLYEYVGTGNERPQLLNVDNAGNLVGADACSAGMSADGRVALFSPECLGTQLWARINETTSIDVGASECTRTSGNPGGACNGSGEVTLAGMASDGSRVLFTTTQQLVNGDTDQTPDLYACNIPPGTPAPAGLANSCESLIDLSGAGANANVQGVIHVSEDGSRVYFLASGVLATNTDARGEPAQSGAHNLYVTQIDAAHPTGQTTFVTRLKSNDISFAQTTPDGRYLAFTTSNQLLPSDTDESQDVYRYDADSGSLLRISTDTAGTGGNTPGFDAILHLHGMSADGSTVVFQTNEALSPADTNGTRDVYAWHDGQVSLISSGRPSVENPAEEKFATVSPSGADVYFTTTAQLTAADIDTAPDIYDARVDGGFPAPTTESCSSEACRGALAAQPAVIAAAGSAAFNAPGSPAPPEAPPANPPKPKPLTRAQKLAKALQACKSKRNRKKRAACEKQARRAHGSTR